MANIWEIFILIFGVNLGRNLIWSLNQTKSEIYQLSFLIYGTKFGKSDLEIFERNYQTRSELM